MASCALGVRFDRVDGRFKLGESVTGSAEVRIESDCQCKALKVACYYKAHGYTHWTLGPRIVIVLFEGHWTAGQTCTYPFEFEPGRGPLTYRGEHFSVDWFIEITAELESARDIKLQESFTMEADEDASLVELQEPASPQQVHRYEIVRMIARFVGLWVIAVPGFIIFGFGVHGVMQGQNAAWLGIVAGFVFSVVGVALGIKAMLTLLGMRRIKIVNVSIDPNPCRSGGEVQIHLDFSTSKFQSIECVTATFWGRELLVRKGSDYERVIHQEERQLAGSVTIEPGQKMTVYGRFIVPAGVPNSFRMVDVQNLWAIQWKIEVRIKVALGADRIQEYDVVVSP